LKTAVNGIGLNGMKRAMTIFCALALCAVLLSPWGGGPAESEEQATTLDARVNEAVDAALSYLASRVQPDGSMPGSFAPVAIAALTGMAFLAGGNVPGRGKYGDEVRRIKDYILSCAHPTSGYITSRTYGGNMYSHGFATLFLAEILGMSPDPKVDETLRKAIRLIEYSQGKLGGWRYSPRPSESDISVTICQVMALRAARNAGVPVDPKVVEKALECVKSCANPDGGFSYLAGNKTASAFPRSAAGVCILYYLGEYDAPEVKKGLRYLMNYVPDAAGATPSSHVFYGYYYATQAMFQAGGEYWRKWYPAVCRWLLRRQLKDGSFSYSMGSDYATAMAAIIMQVPLRYLPILQR